MFPRSAITLQCVDRLLPNLQYYIMPLNGPAWACGRLGSASPPIWVRARREPSFRFAFLVKVLDRRGQADLLFQSGEPPRTFQEITPSATLAHRYKSEGTPVGKLLPRHQGRPLLSTRDLFP